MNSSREARARTIDVHAHVIVPEVYAVAAEHNIFSELPTDPGVTDEMRGQIKERAKAVLGRMSDLSERVAKMDAMSVPDSSLIARCVATYRFVVCGSPAPRRAPAAGAANSARTCS